MSLRPRLVAAVLVSVMLAVPAAGLCEGWAPTAAARMACCVEGAHCAMHETAQASVTQAAADSCCALSQQDPSPAPQGIVQVGALVPLASPVPVLLAAPILPSRYTLAPGPLPGSHVPRHLLLSVFLV